jgi:hypothetical protein
MYESELGTFSAFLTNNQARRLSSEIYKSILDTNLKLWNKKKDNLLYTSNEQKSQGC